jgi:flagellar biosynthesis protein FlhG
LSAEDAALQQAWQASALAQVQAEAQALAHAQREREKHAEPMRALRAGGLYLQANERAGATETARDEQARESQARDDQARDDQAARLRSVMAMYHHAGGQAGGQGQGAVGQVSGHTGGPGAALPARPVVRVTHSAMQPGAGIVTHNISQRAPVAVAPLSAAKTAAAATTQVPAVLPEPLACNVPVIAITSGKGGVGKSSMSVNIAACLAQLRVRATLVDADPGLANADLLCGVSPTTRLESVLASGASRRGMGSIAVRTPAGFALVPGSAGLARMADLGPADRVQLLSSLCELEESSDAVLIDTGAGLSQSVLAFVKHADFVVVVATPEPTSIADAYAIIKLLHAAKKPEPAEVRALAGGLPKRGGVLLVVNQASDEAEAKEVSQRIVSTCQRFLGISPEVLGWIPFDDAVRAAVKARTPITLLRPDSPASKAMRRIAAELALRAGVASDEETRRARGEAKRGGVKGFWGRVFGR